ncbi:hypothetical protein V6Z12_A05G395400 [Gossypium hirsutum]
MFSTHDHQRTHKPCSPYLQREQRGEETVVKMAIKGHNYSFVFFGVTIFRIQNTQKKSKEQSRNTSKVYLFFFFLFSISNQIYQIRNKRERKRLTDVVSRSRCRKAQLRSSSNFGLLRAWT